jgi:hypothetical protein
VLLVICARAFGQSQAAYLSNKVMHMNTLIAMPTSRNPHPRSE